MTAELPILRAGCVRLPPTRSYKKGGRAIFAPDAHPGGGSAAAGFVTIVMSRADTEGYRHAEDTAEPFPGRAFELARGAMLGAVPPGGAFVPAADEPRRPARVRVTLGGTGDPADDRCSCFGYRTTRHCKHIAAFAAGCEAGVL